MTSPSAPWPLPAWRPNECSTLTNAESVLHFRENFGNFGAPSVGTLELEKGTGGPVIMNASNNDYLVLREKVPRICEGELCWMSCDNERQ